MLKHKHCMQMASRSRAMLGSRVLAAAAAGYSKAVAMCGAGATTLELSSRTLPAGRSYKRRAIHTSAAERGSSTTAGVYTTTSSSSSASTFDSNDARPRVCILGGGFGGLYTAIKLELLMWPNGKKPKVTLIDQGERFIFKPLLYELINGTAQSWEVAPTFAQLLAPYPIQFLQDQVVEVQPEQVLNDGGSATGGTVRLASGQSVEYDWLVVSLGAAADPRGVPGVKECAHPFVSLEDAEFVAQQLAVFEARAAVGQPHATIVIVGAGYAGVELAAVVGERVQGKANVVLLTPGMDILESAPAGQREAAQQALKSVGVNIITDVKVNAVIDATATAAAFAAAAVTAQKQQVEANGNSSSSAAYAEQAGTAAAETAAAAVGSNPATPAYIVQAAPAGSSPMPGLDVVELPADLVVWTAGSRAASQPLHKPFPVDARGQLQTDPTLRVVRHTRVFALGDVAKGQPGTEQSSEGSFYPATAQVAFQQADYAAWNIWSAINGRPLLPFRYQHLGDMMSLGATNAAVALPFQIPSQLNASIAASPLSSLLSIVGLKLGDGTQSGSTSSPAGVTLEGPLAQLLRRAAYLYRQPTNEQRINVAASWIQQAADAAARLAAEVSSSSSSSTPGSGSSRRR